MKLRTPSSAIRHGSLGDRPPAAMEQLSFPASNDGCEDGCFFCTGPETD